MDIDAAKLNDWVEQFSRDHERYERGAEVLKTILERGARSVCKTAIVQARAKEVASFAGKCVKNWEKLKDGNALDQLTDLIGGRVIVQLKSEVEKLYPFLRDHVRITQTEDTSQRLDDETFGYGSLHYLATLDKEKLADVPVSRAKSRTRVPKGSLWQRDLDAVDGLVVEIQVRTVAQHVTADFTHDRFYKSPFDVPRIWKRESARVAAQLETVDQTLLDIVAGLESLQTNVGSYMPPAQAEQEIERLKLILEHDTANTGLVNRIATLHLTLGQFEAAAEAIEGFVKVNNIQADEPWDADLESNYGYALARPERENRSSDAFQRGVEHLEDVIDRTEHVEALSRLAELIGDKHLEREYLGRAYKVAPSDPHVLIEYFNASVTPGTARSLMRLLRPSIDEAIGTCEQQIAVGVNLPYALYNLATLHLLAEDVMNALDALARAITLTESQAVRERMLDRFKELRASESPIGGLNWCLDMLRLALSAPGKLHRGLQGRQMLEYDSTRPVVVVAGGCDPRLNHQFEQYGELLHTAFSDYRGAIISGGTKEGVSGMVGAVLARAKKEKRPAEGFSYLPAELPSDGSATEDKRFKHRRRMPVDTEGEAARASDQRKLPGPFYPTIPIQMWIDLIHSGVDPKQVRLVGIDGGIISRFEFRLATALGARVALIRGSGRAVHEIARDAEAPGNEPIMLMPHDPQTVREFVRGRPEPCPFTAGELDALADRIQAAYNAKKAEHEREKIRRRQAGDAGLAEAFRESNRDQACHIQRKLAEVGKTFAPQDGPRDECGLTDAEIRKLAEIEHARWNVERLLGGWVLGENDDQRRKRISLDAWKELNGEYRELDLNAVRVIPDLLRSIGYKIVDQRGVRSPQTESRKASG